MQEGISPQDVKQALSKKCMTVTVSAAGSTRIDFEKRGLSDVVRASLHYFNTEEEVQLLVEAVRRL